MEELNGNYRWHYVNNENKIEGLEGDTQYLVCFESSDPKGSTWHMQLAYWFNKGDELTIRETNGTPHLFDISKDGFYTINEFSDGKRKMFFRIPGVRYWTTIQEPNVDPEDILTIL